MFSLGGDDLHQVRAPSASSSAEGGVEHRLEVSLEHESPPRLCVAKDQAPRGREGRSEGSQDKDNSKVDLIPCSLSEGYGAAETRSQTDEEMKSQQGLKMHLGLLINLFIFLASAARFFTSVELFELVV